LAWSITLMRANMVLTLHLFYESTHVSIQLDRYGHRIDTPLHPNEGDHT
jgi:hypothetical protein